MSAETASPILNTAHLVSMCESKDNLNLLFNRQFDKIPIFDEEEDCQVKPDRANGYKFTLDIQRFYQFIQFGGKSESQVSLGGADHSNNIGIVMLDKESFNREFYFFLADQDDDPSFHVEDKLELAKETQLLQGRAFLKEILEAENTQKWEKKRLEINHMKSTGVGDYRDQAYIDKLNVVTVLPDRNKRKATYIQ